MCLWFILLHPWLQCVCLVCVCVLFVGCKFVVQKGSRNGVLHGAVGSWGGDRKYLLCAERDERQVTNLCLCGGVPASTCLMCADIVVIYIFLFFIFYCFFLFVFFPYILFMFISLCLDFMY